jgi:hypothetical protein
MINSHSILFSLYIHELSPKTKRIFKVRGHLIEILPPHNIPARNDCLFVPFVFLIHKYRGKPIKGVKAVERQTKMKQLQNPSFFGKKRMSSKLIKKL